MWRSAMRAPAARAPAHKCVHTFPWAGTLDLNATPTPPSFTPATCDPAPAYSQAALQRCIANRTVFVLGNSVGRGYAFELRAILEGRAAPTRIEGKKLCQPAPDVGHMIASCDVVRA